MWIASLKIAAVAGRNDPVIAMAVRRQLFNKLALSSWMQRKSVSRLSETSAGKRDNLGLEAATRGWCT